MTDSKRKLIIAKFRRDTDARQAIQQTALVLSLPDHAKMRGALVRRTESGQILIQSLKATELGEIAGGAAGLAFFLGSSALKIMGTAMRSSSAVLLDGSGRALRLALAAAMLPVQQLRRQETFGGIVESVMSTTGSDDTVLIMELGEDDLELTRTTLLASGGELIDADTISANEMGIAPAEDVSSSLNGSDAAQRSLDKDAGDAETIAS